ncbi:hypothetical protein BH09VER1_BH09VER1_24870 [soil metagenome]
MSDGLSFDLSSDTSILRSLQSKVCPCCRQVKLPSKPFCWPCYNKLPASSQSQQSEGYDEQSYCEEFRAAFHALTAQILKRAGVKL